VANAKGAILTERDRALLSYVGIARYASAEQVHRLFFEERSKKQTYRRLAKLCGLGGKLGEGPFLRRLEFRRAEGTAVPVWALAPFGRCIAAESIQHLQPPAAHDVGHRFLEHTLILNDTLVGLVLALRMSDTAPLGLLPFRWLSEDDSVLRFEVREGTVGQTTFHAVLKPDAILEVPQRKRRLFLEGETGTQSIATAHPGRSGAVLAKLRRYRAFFGTGNLRTLETWYQQAFPDKFEPRLVFLVHSAERKGRVEQAVNQALGQSRDEAFRVHVLTFAEAAAALASYISEGTLQSTRVPARQRLVMVDDRKIDELVASYRAVMGTINQWAIVVRKALGKSEPLPPVPLDAIKVLHDFLAKDLRAGDRGAAAGGTEQRGG